jgi:hypothetical protein
MAYSLRPRSKRPQACSTLAAGSLRVQTWTKPLLRNTTVQAVCDVYRALCLYLANLNHPNLARNVELM